MIDDRLEKCAAAYVLGTLTPEERGDFEANLTGNTELQALVSKLRIMVVPGAGTTPAASLMEEQFPL